MLTATQQQGFADVLHTLLTPSAYPSGLEWRSAVTNSLLHFLDADLVTFRLPRGEPEIVNSHSGWDVVRSLADAARAPEQPVAIHDVILELGAFNRGLLLRRQASLTHAAENLPDPIIIDDAFDWLALTAEMPPHDGLPRVASIVLHRDPTSSGTFGNIGLALARLLVPAFRAGMVTYCGMMQQRDALGGIVGEADVRERFGLTPKEATVCLLLARGKTNAEIAAALSISRYTARRHTEKVLRKLQVRKRAEIAPALLQGVAATLIDAPQLAKAS